MNLFPAIKFQDKNENIKNFRLWEYILVYKIVNLKMMKYALDSIFWG